MTQKQSDMVQITLRLPLKLKQQAQECARLEGISLAEFVRRAISAYLDRRDKEIEK